MKHAKLWAVGFSLLALVGCGSIEQQEEETEETEIANEINISNYSISFKESADIDLLSYIAPDYNESDPTEYTFKLIEDGEESEYQANQGLYNFLGGYEENLTVTINDTTINIGGATEYESSTNNYDYDYARYADINDTYVSNYGSVSTSSYTSSLAFTCVVSDLISNTPVFNNEKSYSGDILQVQCTQSAATNFESGSVYQIDTFTSYYKKNVGMVARVDEDCYDEDTGYVLDEDGCSVGSTTYILLEE